MGMGLGLDAILPGIGAVQSIIGAFGASARAKQAQAAREMALENYSSQLDRDYQDTVTGNLTALRRAGGALGDQLHGYATDVGDASAGAGVYNSSAVAGAIAQQGHSNAQALGNMAQNNFTTEQSLLNSNRRDLAGQRIGIATQNYQQALADRNASFQGLSSNLGGLGQYFQQRQLAGQRQGQQDAFFSTLQKAIQPTTGQSYDVQNMSSRNNGIMMNGNQGSQLIDPSKYGLQGQFNSGRRLF